MRKTLAVLFLFLWATLVLSNTVRADPRDAVVCIPSHGGSGTVIGTGEGYTYVLSCWHCFETEKERQKPIVIDVPKAWLNGPQKVGIKLIALGDSQCDLALIKINYGPVHTVVPIAPKNHRITQECMSMGFDSMQYPAQVRPARIQKADQFLYWTDSRPWHGRSGGALIEKSTGYLVGVCHAYTGPKNHAEFHQGANGLYINHTQVYNFLIRAKVLQDTPIGSQQMYSSPQGNCPGGVCPIPQYGAPSCPNCPQRR